MAPKAKKAPAVKKTAAGKVEKKAAAKPAAKAAAPAADESAFDVVIEACTSWGVFKRRANELEELVKAAAPGASVARNPSKPRRGTFEVRAGKGGGKAYVSLTALPRPFKALREMDLEAVASAVAADLS